MKKENEIIKTNKEILPIRYYDYDIYAYVLEDESHIGIVEKTSKDIDNLSNDEIQYEMMKMAKFYKMYKGDIKLVSMNFPVNTQRQRLFLKEKLEETNNAIQKKWLGRSIDELSRIDINVTRREYYILFFSKNKEEHIKNSHLINNLLGVGGNGLAKKLPMEKSHYVWHKLSNMNTLVTIKEEEYEEE